jgi:hypothetical protein
MVDTLVFVYASCVVTERFQTSRTKANTDQERTYPAWMDGAVESDAALIKASMEQVSAPVPDDVFNSNAARPRSAFASFTFNTPTKAQNRSESSSHLINLSGS